MSSSQRQRSIWFHFGMGSVLASMLGGCGVDSLDTGQEGDERKNEPANTLRSDSQTRGLVTDVTGFPVRGRQEAIQRARERRAQKAAEASRRMPAKRLMTLKPELGLGDLDMLRPVRAEPFDMGCGAVRCEHYHDGIRVINSLVIVHTDRADTITSLTNHLRTGVNLSTTPTLKPEQAIRIAMADPERTSLGDEPAVELSILPLEQLVVKATQKPPTGAEAGLSAGDFERRVVGHQLVYVVTVDSVKYRVDAHTGKILHKQSQLHTFDTTGHSLYDYPNNASNPNSFSDIVPLVVHQNWMTEMLTMQAYGPSDSYHTVVDNGYTWNPPTPNELDPDLAPWGNGDGLTTSNMNSFTARQTAMTDVNYALSATRMMWSKVFWRDGVDNDGGSQTAAVHVTSGIGDSCTGGWCDNARYDSSVEVIYVGDGDGTNVGKRTSLDTIAHEYGHALDYYSADLLSADEGTHADGMAEGTADINAVWAKYYVWNLGLLNPDPEGSGPDVKDPLPDGRYVVQAGGIEHHHWRSYSSGRDARRRNLAHWFPNIGAEDSHDSGGPFAQAFYFLAMGASIDPGASTYSEDANGLAPNGNAASGFAYRIPNGMAGVGVDTAARVWYHAMTYHFSSSTDYNSFANELLEAAKHVCGEQTNPEPPCVIAARFAAGAVEAGAGASFPGSTYPLPEIYNEIEPNNNTATMNWVSMPSVPSSASLPRRLQINGAAHEANDMYNLSVPSGYAAKISLVPWQRSPTQNNSNMAVYDVNNSLIGLSVNGGSTPEIFRVPYNSTGSNKWYHFNVDGYDTIDGGNYYVFIDWIPFCSASASSKEIHSTSGVTTMVGCAGEVTFANRASLCAQGAHVCSAAEWNARRSMAPTHNYWTDDDLKYNGSSGSCSASLTTGTSCGGNPMRVCTATQGDPLGNQCNWTGCGLDTNTNQYFGGCVGNTTAGSLCCFD